MPEYHPEATSDRDLEYIVGELRVALATDGWEVSLELADQDDGDVFNRNVVFKHPLSGELQASVRNDLEPEVIRSYLWGVIDKKDGDREFGVISTRPQSISHPNLLRHIREGIAAHDWPTEQVKEFLDVLRASGLVSRGEAAWILKVGPCPLLPGRTWPNPPTRAARGS